MSFYQFLFYIFWLSFFINRYPILFLQPSFILHIILKNFMLIFLWCPHKSIKVSYFNKFAHSNCCCESLSQLKSANILSDSFRITWNVFSIFIWCSNQCHVTLPSPHPPPPPPPLLVLYTTTTSFDFISYLLLSFPLLLVLFLLMRMDQHLLHGYVWLNCDFVKQQPRPQYSKWQR